MSLRNRRTSKSSSLRVGNVELVVRLTAEVAKKVGYYGCFDPSAYRGTPTGSTYRLRRS